MKLNAYRDNRLDFLRFIAIFLVLGRHTYSTIEEFLKIPLANRTFLQNILIRWQKIGWVGVDLFFVLSGYLISNLIFTAIVTNKFSLKSFYVRREFKIYLPFLFFILTTTTFDIVTKHDVDNALLFHELFFLQNYLGGKWNHTWSLAVEEHFYIFLPILILFMHKISKVNKLPIILFLLMIFVLVLRVLHLKNSTGQIDSLHFFFPTHLRIDSFIPGILIAYLKCYNKDRFDYFISRSKYYYVGLLLTFIIYIYFIEEDSLLTVTLGFTFLSIGFAVLLLFVLSINETFFNKYNPIRLFAYVGRDSYSIYLWHMLVYLVIHYQFYRITHLNISSEITFMVYVFSSITLGIILSRIIEKPVLKLREKFFPAL